MSEKNFSCINKKLLYKIMFGFALVSVIIGTIALFPGKKDQLVLKTAVITSETPVFMDPDLTEEYSGHLKNGDLINVIYRHDKDVYYILDSGAEMPFSEGYISSDYFSYKFDNANQAILGTNTVFSAKDNQKPAGYVVEKGRTRCIIHGFEEDGWVSISLPGGLDGLWVQKDRLIYDLNFDLKESENFGHYRLVKEYMKNEYLSTYDKYYDHNYVQNLADYDETFNESTGELICEFVMSGMSKNKYRDPDTVKYIKEAKDAATDDAGRLYYETLYREYNMYRNANFVLKLTATVEDENLTDVKLFSDTGVGATSEWKELEKGLKNFIIEE